VKLELTRSGEGAVLVAGGRLTASVAGRLRNALLEAFSGASRVELALRDVEEADLTLLQLVCAAHRTAGARDVAFVVSGWESEAARRLLREAGLTRADTCPAGCPFAGADAGPACPAGG
jgi:anti-anti-sigma regulatory factor